MAIIPVGHHVAQALRAYNAANKYMGFARASAWTNDAAPPAPSPNTTALDGALFYAPLTRVILVIPDAGGAITFGGATYTEVAAGQAYTLKATRVLFECRLAGTDISVATYPVYRQVGVFTGLVKSSGTGILLPGQVTDPGVLEILDNRSPLYRAADKIDIITSVVQF